MKDLEEQQRAMRERNRRAAAKPERAAGKVTAAADDRKQAEPVSASSNKNELEYLRRRVAALERENADLRLEAARLRQISGRPEQSYKSKRLEQQHNFFKYSNIRRY